MKIRIRFVRAAGITVAVVGLLGLSLPGVASASSALFPREGEPLHCAFQTINGHYLTAVGGGGRTTDVLHTDATSIGSWEFFTPVVVPDGPPGSLVHVGLMTIDGHYLTAVDGGGRNTDVIHSNATNLLGWEEFTLIGFGSSNYAIQTIDGHYLTAVNGGGQANDAIHSDATRIAAWEMFHTTCIGD